MFAQLPVTKTTSVPHHLEVSIPGKCLAMMSFIRSINSICLKAKYAVPFGSNECGRTHLRISPYPDYLGYAPSTG